MCVLQCDNSNETRMQTGQFKRAQHTHTHRQYGEHVRRYVQNIDAPWCFALARALASFLPRMEITTIAGGVNDDDGGGGDCGSRGRRTQFRAAYTWGGKSRRRRARYDAATHESGRVRRSRHQNSGYQTTHSHISKNYMCSSTRLTRLISCQSK